MAERKVSDEFEFSVATMPPTLRHRQLALAVVAILLIAFGAVAPFATTPLPRIDGFIPAVLAIIFVTDLATAALLFGQFSIIGSRALLVLANGYLFSALIVVSYTLVFPGAFAPAGLLGAGLQSTPWLYLLWHFGFPVAVVGYAYLKNGKLMKDTIKPSVSFAVHWSVVVVISMVCVLTWGVTAGDKVLPRLVKEGGLISIEPLGQYLSGVILLTCVLALLLVWTRRTSVLDLWLMVAICALIADLTMVTLSLTARFSLGFYSIRVFSVVVSTVVLVVLLSETTRLYARLSIANSKLQRERESKLANLEAVVAAIAHEVRQPLTGIASQAAAGRRFIGRALPDIHRVKSIFDEIERASFHADEVFDSIRTLFRNGGQEQRPVDVNELALGALQLLRRELEDHRITTSMQLISELPPVTGHKGQLQEVILNLVQNSIDAMAPMTHGSRVLRITTERHGLDAIAISVEDSGPGIDPQKKSSIFDPFVTTKAKGMGLGLAICQMIIERHGGQLSASSDVNSGARFQIILPIETAAHSLSAAL